MKFISFGDLRKKLLGNSSFKSLVVCATVIAGALGTVACDPAADHVLSTADKVADMHWLFSIFRNNYAPLEYKESRNGYNIERLQQVYMAKAKRAKTNDEFYRVMAQFVAEFEDAHTGGSITPASLPGQATIAYLGISGVRDGKNFRVTEILASIDKDNFPISVGDKITEVDGMPVFEYIDRNLVPYRNFGNDMANKTIHMKNLFTRMSLTLPIPEKDDVKLTIQTLLGNKPKRVSLPWIKKDLYDFKLERALFEASKNSGAKSLRVEDPHSSQELALSILDQRGIPMSVSDLIDRYKGRGSKNFLNTFKLSAPSAIELSNAKPKAEDAPVTGFKALQLERTIPDGAVAIADANSFPAYVYSTGTGRAKKRIGYVRIASFEVDASKDDAVK